MAVFGWIMIVLLTLFAMFVISLLIYPTIASEIKVTKYKIKRQVEDRKIDTDKRSEEKRRRDEIKRKKDFELANKKLEKKLQKVNEKIRIHEEQLLLAKQLKEATRFEDTDELSAVEHTVIIDTKSEKANTKSPKSVESTSTDKIIVEEEINDIEVTNNNTQLGEQQTTQNDNL